MLFECFSPPRSTNQMDQQPGASIHHTSDLLTFPESASWPPEGLPLSRNSSLTGRFWQTNRTRSEQASRPRLALQTTRKGKDRRDVVSRCRVTLENQIEPRLCRLATICKRWEALRRQPSRERQLRLAFWNVLRKAWRHRDSCSHTSRMPPS